MTNIKLTYDYTLNSIKIIREGIDKINTKLGLVVTLSGILVNFGKDLPGYDLAIAKTGLTYTSQFLSCKSYRSMFSIVRRCAPSDLS